MRASEGSEPAKADCEDPIIKAACLLDSDECPAECKDSDEKEDTVVKSGDLAVTAVANKWASVISNGATSELDTLTFKASEDITLKSITLERYGYSTPTSVASIWLEDKDGNKVTSEKSLSPSKDTVTLTLKKDYQNISNGDELLVVITTPLSDDPEKGNASELGKSIGFKVKDVDSSAKNLDLSNYSANLYEIIDYSGTDATVTFKGSDKKYNYEEGKSYEVSKIKVSASNAAILVNWFTLKQADTIEDDNEVKYQKSLDLDKYVDEVEVLVDGKSVKSKASLKRDEIKVSFDDQEIAINKSSTFTINVTLKDFDDLGAAIKLWFEKSSDADILESKNKVRVSIKEFDEATGLYGKVYAFNGGKINLTNTKLSSTIDAAAGSDDVVIAQGKIALGWQTVRVKTITMEPETKGSEVENAQYVESLRLIIGDEEYEATEKNGWAFKDVVIEEDADVKLTADIIDLLKADEDAVPTPTITIDVKVKPSGNGAASNAFSKTTLDNIKYDDVRGDGDASTNLVGTINISGIKVQPAKWSLTNDSTKKVEFKVKETTEKTVFKGTYTAKNNGNVNLDNVKIARTNNKAEEIVPADSDITFTVKIDGKAVATIDNPTAAGDDADFSPIAVESGKSVSVEVIANVYAWDKTTYQDNDDEKSYNLEYKIFLSGKDDAGNNAGNANKALAPMSFVKADSVNVSTNASMKQQDVVLADKNQNLATFIVKPANKASVANLDTLAFSLNDLNENDALDELVVELMGANTDIDDIFEVLINGKTADNLWYLNGVLTVSDINTDIEGETKVEVNFKEELTTEKAAATVYAITLTKVNNDENFGESYVYKRTAVNTLVRVEKMSGNKDSDTKYVFDIDYSDNAGKETVDVTFDFGAVRSYAEDGETILIGEDETWTNVQDGKTYSTPNVKDKVFYVTTISWTDGDGYKVLIPYEGNEDFFKTNGSNEDRLRAYADD